VSLRDEIRAVAHRKSAWVLWAVTGAACFLLGYLSSHGWHW
jgi:hypothetical protein